MTFRSLTIFLAFVTTLSITISARAQFSPSSQPNNAFLNIDSDFLYDQKDIIASATYRRASETERPDLLEAYFRAKKSEILNAQVNSKLKWVGGGLIAQFGMFWVIKKMGLDVAQSAWLSGSAIGMVINGILFSSMNDLTNAFSASQHDPLESYEIAYVRHKPKFSKAMQQAIEENFTSARRAASLDRHFSFAHFAINMPTDIKPIENLDKEAFEKRFSSQNNPETYRGINEWVRRYIRRLSNPDLPRYAGYFYGQSRTGKTTAAEWIADFLEVPFEKINLGGRSVQELFGTSKNSANPDPGLLIRALVNAKRRGKGAKNVIILLDEADRLLNRDAKDGGSNDWLTRFLTLLDPNTKSFYSDYFEAEIDINSVGIIMAGNGELADVALKKRLQEVPFDGYSKDYKKNVIWSEWIPNLIQKQTSFCKVKLSDFKEEDIQAIVDNDTDPGFRSVEWQVGQYFLAIDEKKCGWGV